MLIKSTYKDLPVVAQFTPLGASLTRWQIGERDILFPLSQVVNHQSQHEIRGLSHPCLPWFGDKFGVRHGLLRNYVFPMPTTSADGFLVSFNSSKFRGSSTFRWMFDGVVSARVSGNKLSYSMFIRNPFEYPKNEDRGNMPVQFAWHPYLLCTDNSKLHIGSEVIPVSDWKPGESVEFTPTGDVAHMTLGGKETIELRMHPGFASSGGKVVIWSNNPQQYICMEPVTHTVDLELGQSASVTFTLKFIPD